MREFTDSETEALLRRESDGVLAMARDDEPYAIPLSFGYDGSRFVFQLGGVDSGRKMAFIEDNPEVVFVVHDTRANKVAESVVARGRIERVPAREQRAAFDTLRENAEFPLDGSIWGRPPEETRSELYVLEPREITGRAYGESGA